jgi:ABC-type dipeptide/oligopeptide/nickel transport system permease component
LQNLIELVTTPLGGLAYHVVTLFALQLVLGVAFEYWNRHRRDVSAIGFLVTAIDLAFARLLLVVIVVLGRVGVLSSAVVMPPLERFLDFFTMLLVAGTFLPVLQRHWRLGAVLLFIPLLAMGCIYAASSAFWPRVEAQGIAYNVYWQGIVWECATIATLLLGLVAGVIWRKDDWARLVGLFTLWLVGHVLQLAMPIADSHAAGWVRLVNLVALPLLTALAYRRAMREPPAPTGAADCQTWLRRGVSAARAGDRVAARRCFQAAREAAPDNVFALLWLGWLAHTPQESLALFGRVLELDPENENAHTGVGWAKGRVPLDVDQSSGVEAIPTAPPGQLPPLEIPEGMWGKDILGQMLWLDKLAGVIGACLRFAWRMLSLLVLLMALIFFIALAADLGQRGGLHAFPAALSSAASFTVDYVTDLAHGDLGLIAPSYPSAPAEPVTAELARALPRSLGLLAVSLVLAVIIGLTLGIGAGLRRKTRFSGLLVFSSVLGISTPSYFAAMLLIWFGVWLYRATGADFLPLHGFGWDAHLILPALVLAARPAANVMRLGYNALVDVLDADYVRTAYAKGLGPRIVLFRHVLRSAGVPLLTTVAVSLRFSLAILPIVEYIFNWSGVGEELLRAIQIQDTTTVVGMVLPLAFLFVVANFLLEMLYLVVDPRLRITEVGAA